jgi:hypothetical protein
MEIFMQRRLDSLGPDARAVVRTAGVLGGTWDLPLIARCCGAHTSFAGVGAAAAELVHEGMWVHAAAADDDSGGAACYTFAHEVVRSLVFAATPEDERAKLHATVLARLEERAASGGGGSTQQAASAWAEWARLARGAGDQHAKAAGFSLRAARAAMASAAARGVSDAARAARDGLASLRAAAAQQAAADADADADADAGAAAGASGGRLARASHAAAHRLTEEEALRLSGARLHTPRCSAADADRAATASPRAANPAHTQLWRDLSDVLHTVRVVQASWALVQPGLQTHALAMTHAFIARCPTVLLHVRGKHGLDFRAPEMGPIMVTHSATLITLVGQCVAGQRDFDAIRPTLVACGRMHARFSAHLRDFLPGMGTALLDTLRGALGEADAFPPEVEAAWGAVYAWVAAAMTTGVDAALADQAGEAQLRGALVLAPPAAAAAAAGAGGNMFFAAG